MTDHSNHDGKRQEVHTITELCREFGVTPRTLRYYEQRKLLAPARRGSRRVFSNRDRARLLLTLRAKRFGFTLTEIKVMLDLYDSGGKRAQMQATLPKLEARLVLLRKEHDRLTEAVAELANECKQISLALRQKT